MARSIFSSILAESSAPAEFLFGALAPLDRSLPRGDGRAMMLIPGFWGSDASLMVLRSKLVALGFDAVTWGLGLNNRCGQSAVDRVLPKIEQLVRRRGKPISLIGHSRGGLVARAIARLRPDLVDCIVTLGSPIAGRDVRAMSPVLQPMMSISRALFTEQPGCLTVACQCDYVRGYDKPLPASVRVCAVWSRHDGVVAPEQCVRPGEPAVEVGGSHVGLVARPAALRTIVAVLAGKTIQSA